MKLNKYVTALLISKMLALSGLYAQTVVGYSSLFTFDTRNTNLDFVGYSGLFTFDTRNINLDFVGYSGLFTFDTRNIIPDLFIEYLNITGGADTCFEALQTIVVTDLTVEPGNSLNLVAGESVIIHPRTSINAGANFQAYIDTTGTYCHHEGPSNILTLGGDVSAGVDTCLAAINRIMVSDLIIESNAVIKLVAGELIVIHPHTRINSGADFRAYIDTTGTYCHQPESMMVVFDDSEEITDQKSIFHKEKSKQFFSLFPNPTAGTFTLQLNNAEETTEITVDIYSLIGELIVQTQLAGKQQYEFDLRGKPDGVYLIRVLRGKEVGVDKLIKQ